MPGKMHFQRGAAKVQLLLPLLDQQNKQVPERDAANDDHIPNDAAAIRSHFVVVVTNSKSKGILIQFQRVRSQRLPPLVFGSASRELVDCRDLHH